MGIFIAKVYFEKMLGMEELQVIEKLLCDYEYHMMQGQDAFQRGDFDVSEKHFASALRQVDEDLELSKSSDCLESLGDIYMQRGISLPPDGTSEHHQTVGDHFIRATGLYNAARVRWEKILEMDYENSQTGSTDCENSQMESMDCENSQTGPNCTENANKEVCKKIECIWDKIKSVEKEFLKNVCGKENCLKVSSSESDKENKKWIQSLREEIRKIFANLDSEDEGKNPYVKDVKDFSFKKSTTLEMERAEFVYQEIAKRNTEEMKNFIRMLLQKCYATLGVPPCQYAFIGMGSLAREEMTPFSDLEFAVLISEGSDTEDNRNYFKHVVDYLHLLVLNLGETLLPLLAIKSLNNFDSSDPLDNWFYDSHTPSGLCFDGAMPWACKTPRGRGPTKEKKWAVELIQTPSNMAAFHSDFISAKEGYHISEVLSGCCYIHGDERLVEEYQKHVDEMVESPQAQNTNKLNGKSGLFQGALQFLGFSGSQETKSKPETAQLRAIETLKKDLKRYNISARLANEDAGKAYNVKKEIYRFPSTIISSLGKFFLIPSAVCSTWQVIEYLHKCGMIDAEGEHHLKVVWGISTYLRFKTYSVNMGQKEEVTLVPKFGTTDDQRLRREEKLDIDFCHLKYPMVIFRFYFTAYPLHALLEEWVREKLENKMTSPKLKKLYRDDDFIQGLVYRRLYQLKEARECLERCLQESPLVHDPLTIHILLGKLLHSLSLYEDGNVHFLKAEKILQEENYENHYSLKASILHNLGYGNLYCHKNKEALDLLEASLDVCQRHLGIPRKSYDNITTLMTIGVTYGLMGDDEQDIKYHKEALKLLTEKLGENELSVTLSILYNNLGTSYARLGQKKLGIEYHEKSLIMRRKIFGDIAHPLIKTNLQILLDVQLQDGYNKKSMQYMNEVLKMDKSLGNEPKNYYDYNNSGMIHLKFTFDIPKALEYFQKSLELCKDDQQLKAIAMNNIGYALKHLGFFSEAVCYAQKSIEYLMKCSKSTFNNNLMSRFIHNLGVYYLHTQEYPEALVCLLGAHQTRSEPNLAKEQLLTESFLLVLQMEALGNWPVATQVKECVQASEIFSSAPTLNENVQCCRTQDQHEENITKNSDEKSHFQPTSLNTVNTQSLRVTESHQTTSSCVLSSLAIPDKDPDFMERNAAIFAPFPAFKPAKDKIELKQLAEDVAEKISMKLSENEKPEMDMVTILNNVGRVFISTGGVSQGLHYHQRAFEYCKSVYDPAYPHADVADTNYYYGLAFMAQKDNENAKNHIEKALDIMKKIHGNPPDNLNIKQWSETLKNMACDELGSESLIISSKDPL